MSKKYLNKKKVNQSNRNQVLNKRYRSLEKSISKQIYSKIDNFIQLTSEDEKNLAKKSATNLLNAFKSILDKCLKKKVYHRKTVARKKSKLEKFLIHRLA